MKRLPSLIAILLLIVVTGCATDPIERRNQVADYDRAVTAAAETVRDAIRAGVFKDAPKIQEAAVAAVNEANAVGQKLHTTADPADHRFWLRQGSEALARVAVYISQAKKEGR